MHSSRPKSQDLLRYSLVHGSRDRQQKRVLRAACRYLGTRRAPLCPSLHIANSRSEVKTTRSCTIIFRSKSSNSQTMSQLQQGSSFKSSSIKLRRDASVPSRSSRTRGARLALKSTKCSAQLSCQASPSRATVPVEQASIKPSVCNLEPGTRQADSKTLL